MKSASCVDGTVVLALGASAGALGVTAPVTAGAFTLVMAAFLLRERRVFLAIACALGFAVAAARGASAVRRFEHEHARIETDAWPSRCAFRGAIASEPVQVGTALRVEVVLDHADCDRGRAHGRVALHVPLEVAVEPRRGDVVEGVAGLAPPYRFWNDDIGDPRPRETRRGIALSGGAEDLRVMRRAWSLAALVDAARSRARARILATFPAETQAMARALVLGEDDLADDDRRAFRRSGLSHLLAVSGMHLVLVVATAVGVLRAVLVRVHPVACAIDVSRIAAAVGIPLAWIYADFAGGSGSAIRAAWMMSVGFLARVLARRPNAWRSLGLSMLALVAVDPLVAFDLSFALSAAATAGILALGPSLQRPFARLGPAGELVAPPLAATAGASLACAPILALMTPELPIAGLVANLVAVPIGEVLALPLCLGHLVLAPLPVAERGAAMVAASALDLVRIVAHRFAAIPYGTTPVPLLSAAEIGVLAVIAYGAACLAGARRRLWMVAGCMLLAGLELGEHLRGAPKGVLRATFLDVGQGDAAIVDLPDGSVMLVDGGGLVGSPIDVGERVVAPMLRARRRSHVDVVVLSHPHPDHYGGLVAGTARVTLGALWDVGLVTSGGEHARVVERLRARGAVVIGPESLCGVHTIGSARVEVLAPCPSTDPDAGANDNSFVLRIGYGRRSFLFAGDAERSEESRVLARAGVIRADVLKLGHHGSRTSSTAAWLAAIAPEIAVVSCGVRNRFGHPHASTIAALARAGPRVFRTDRDGAVTVTTDGDALVVETP